MMKLEKVAVNILANATGVSRDEARDLAARLSEEALRSMCEAEPVLAKQLAQTAVTELRRASVQTDDLNAIHDNVEAGLNAEETSDVGPGDEVGLFGPSGAAEFGDDDSGDGGEDE